ncbi:TPA: gamma-glutamylcyclotransferase [Pseudomonas aeruginosa]|nr:gamma-glutamylcyclotransferase [Pseudomonas aeruginosa]
MLTRELISTGAYLDSFQDLPGQPCWTQQRIDASMREALAQRPQGAPVWLFAYGSLIWNPLLKFVERQSAVLQGWHRSFCIGLFAGRGTYEMPGRMLALNTGGQSAGVAFRLDEKDLLEELGLVWVREMVHGLYRPVWGSIRLACGRTVPSLAFVAETSHAQYERDATIATTAPLIARASGHMGSNRDYLLQLEATLAEHGIVDEYIHALASAVRTYPSEGTTT